MGFQKRWSSVPIIMRFGNINMPRIVRDLRLCQESTTDLGLYARLKKNFWDADVVVIHSYLCRPEMGAEKGS